MPGDFAPVDFPALIHWDGIDDKNPLWHLPPAQLPPAKFQEIGFAHARGRHHTCRHFLMTQCRLTAKYDRLAHAGEAQQMRFHFRRMHFFPGDIDPVGNTANNAKAILRFR